MNWLILKTDSRKEAYVSRQVQNLGFDAWLPLQLVASRPAAARKMLSKAGFIIKELPILPRRVFCAIPAPVGGDVLAIRHVVGVECDAALTPIRIPSMQIAAFRAEIDRENMAALALAQKASRKQKARWRSLHDALLEMIEDAKSKYEIAA